MDGTDQATLRELPANRDIDVCMAVHMYTYMHAYDHVLNQGKHCRAVREGLREVTVEHWEGQEAIHCLTNPPSVPACLAQTPL